MPRSEYRNAPNAQILFLRIGPPSDASHWLTDWLVGVPPGATLFCVLSLFQSNLAPSYCTDPLRTLPPRGARMFITTLVPVGELASTPPSFTSASAIVSVPMSIWNAAPSL